MDLDQFKNLDIELINQLKYTNYGQLRESNSVDLSNTNRLAVCTDKCVLILNKNFEWPSQLNNSSPFKFFINQKIQNEKNKQQIQIDEWIQDLSESKNDAFSINVIRSVPKSEKFSSIFKKFQDLNEYKNSKQKSFQKQLQFMTKRCNLNERELSNKNLVESNTTSLKEQNSEEFLIHKTLLDQSRLFDSDFYQFLSFLNPYSSGAAQENDLQNSFKFCKWNLNTKINLLFTLTEYNQMIIFDCTKFTNTNNCLKENENSHYRKIFDFKSNSKLIDLSDFFITNHNSDLINHNFKSIQDFMTCLRKIIPKAVSWGPEVYTRNGLEYEILLIAFKSNQIAVFYVYRNLNVELYKLIDLTDKLFIQVTDEMVDTSLDQENIVEIVDVAMGKNFVCCFVLSDGRILTKKLSDDKFDLIYTKLNGLVKKINFDFLNENLFLLIVQTENEVVFFLLDNLELKSELAYNLDEEKYSAFTQKPVKNYLTQGFFKLIDVKLMKNMSYMLIFENGLIDLVQLSVNDSKLLAKNTIINTNLNLNFKPESSQSNQEIFKTIKQIYLSSNNLILYQVNDFGKSSLIQKRPANFEINVYRMKNLNKNMIEYFLNSNLNISPSGLNDFIWLFKNDLYFNNKDFMKENFDVIYDNFKNYRRLVQDKKDKIFYLKRTRILAYLMRNYFEAVANFDSLNSKIGVEVDESSEESDYRDEDDQETESKANLKKDSDSSMVKSVSFYDLIFRETTLLIFKYFCVDLIRKAYSIEYDKLDPYEKFLIVQMGNFGIRKNFFQKTEFGSEIKEIEEWIKKNEENSNDTEFWKFCDLCGKKFSSDGNLNLNKIRCISGHNMNRCEKTLMPLNNFRYKKCKICNSKWNSIESETGMIKNFENILSNQNNVCLYCD